ncbi:hypothetical protein DFQ28_006322 [Apophysomyces sp. BC1034]|nr:hypothetical protein DFQ30_003567 [Apophysomyces sp. BC1015]KAG0178988.1 hypothetical protein DFQ29_002730 [Apophysomyces sp. BC1021]KAG0187440.1 hypothetical protein DFQ28_006322 [Apophysomyces sp. BC1034]
MVSETSPFTVSSKSWADMVEEEENERYFVMDQTATTSAESSKTLSRESPEETPSVKSWADLLHEDEDVNKPHKSWADMVEEDELLNPPTPKLMTEIEKQIDAITLGKQTHEGRGGREMINSNAVQQSSSASSRMKEQEPYNSPPPQRQNNSPLSMYVDIDKCDSWRRPVVEPESAPASSLPKVEVTDTPRRKPPMRPRIDLKTAVSRHLRAGNSIGSGKAAVPAGADHTNAWSVYATKRRETQPERPTKNLASCSKGENPEKDSHVKNSNAHEAIKISKDAMSCNESTTPFVTDNMEITLTKEATDISDEGINGTENADESAVFHVMDKPPILGISQLVNDVEEQGRSENKSPVSISISVDRDEGEVVSTGEDKQEVATNSPIRSPVLTLSQASSQNDAPINSIHDSLMTTSAFNNELKSDSLLEADLNETNYTTIPSTPDEVLVTVPHSPEKSDWRKKLHLTSDTGNGMAAPAWQTFSSSSAEAPSPPDLTPSITIPDETASIVPREKLNWRKQLHSADKTDDGMAAPAWRQFATCTAETSSLEAQSTRAVSPVSESDGIDGSSTFLIEQKSEQTADFVDSVSFVETDGTPNVETDAGIIIRDCGSSPEKNAVSHDQMDQDQPKGVGLDNSHENKGGERPSDETRASDDGMAALAWRQYSRSSVHAT